MKKYLASFLILGAPLASFADEVQPKKTFIEYNNRMSVFNPAHQTYERTKPNAFYVGVESWAVPLIACDDYDDFNDYVLCESELRFGYNFFYNGKDHITPIIGGGFIKDLTKYTLSDGSHYRRPGLGYGMIGFLYDHEFNTIFNLGFNLKGMIGGGGSNSHFKWGTAIAGVDVALPITFRFGHKRHWDYRIEPFYQYLYGSDNSANYGGFRGTLGYRF